MRHTLRWMAALAVLMIPALMLTSPLTGAPKDKDKDVNTEKTIKAGQLTGKVVTVYEDKRKIRLQVTINVPKLDQGAIDGVRNAQNSLMQAMAQRPINYQSVQQARVQLAQAQARPTVTYDRQTQDVELTVRDDVVVRSLRPKEDFDEKGKIKKYTAADLKKLKGDPKLPGYTAEFGDVTAEQYLTVTLVKKKGAVAVKPPPVKKPKGKGKGEVDLDAQMDLLADNMPQVSMIMIVRDVMPAK